MPSTSNRTSHFTESVIRRMTRVANACEEIGHISEFDYVIINDRFDEALRDLQAVIRARRLKTEKQLRRHAEMVNRFK